MSYDHIQVRFLEPREWWAQGFDRPAEGAYAVVNTSDRYQHPRYAPRPVPRIISDAPIASYEAAQALRDRWVDDWEFETYALDVERGDDDE